MSASSLKILRREEEEEEGTASATSNLINGNSEWEPGESWLRSIVLAAAADFVAPFHTLDDPKWWRELALACGGLDRATLPRKFAAMRAKLIEKPASRPVDGAGWKSFVRHWLMNEEKADGDPGKKQARG